MLINVLYKVKKPKASALKSRVMTGAVTTVIICAKAVPDIKTNTLAKKDPFNEVPFFNKLEMFFIIMKC